MVSKRLIHEEGHKRKFLVVIDDSQECDHAVLYAARRAHNTGGALTMVFISEPEDFQHWIGVEEIMKQEAREAAEQELEKHAQFSRERANVDPELIYREGKKLDEIQALVEEDQDIAVLVLAAGDSSDGPGPLTSSLARNDGTFTIPVIVVPSAMTFEEIESVT